MLQLNNFVELSQILLGVCAVFVWYVATSAQRRAFQFHQLVRHVSSCRLILRHNFTTTQRTHTRTHHTKNIPHGGLAKSWVSTSNTGILSRHSLQLSTGYCKICARSCGLAPRQQQGILSNSGKSYQKRIFKVDVLPLFGGFNVFLVRSLKKVLQAF